MSAASDHSNEMRDFAEVLARALLMILHYLNKRYQLNLKLKEREGE